MQKLIHHLKYYLAIVKLSYMTALTYRASHVLRYFRILMEFIISIIFINIVFSKTSNLGTWTKPEVFLVFAIWTTAFSAHFLLLSDSLYQTSRDIREGEIDFLLTRPLDSQFLSTFRAVHVDNIFRVLGGIIMMVYSLNHLFVIIPLANWILFGAQFIASVVILYSFLFLGVSAAFATSGTEQMHILESILQVGKYPMDIFNPKITIVMSSILPLIFISTVPARTLLGKLDYLSWIIFPVAGILFFISRKTWKFALRHYSSASS